MVRNEIFTGKKVAKVLIVDDHPVVRDGLSVRISRQPDLEICGEAEDVADALQLIDATDPDVAVIDISLKSGNGIDLIKRIRARNKSVRMLVWSMYNETLYAERALRAGAMGYVDKGSPTRKIIEAIRCVLNGKVYLSESISSEMLGRVVGGGTGVEHSPVENLSDRELETFKLIGQGLGTREIAEQLHLSPKTVDTYRARIKEKLNLRSSSALTQRAVQWVLENG